MLALTCACSVLLSGKSAAQEDAYDRTGFYLGLTGTYAVPTALDDVDLSFPSARPGLDITVEGADAGASLGYHARGGYRLHPHLAVEVHFEDLAGFDISSEDGQRPEPQSSADIAIVEGWTLTGDLKVFLRRGAIQPYVVAGAGMMHADAEDTSSGKIGTGEPIVADVPEGDAFAVRLGAGLDMYLSPHFAVVLDAAFVLPTAPINDLRYISFGWGFQYRF
jgi:opacity protein-like surface antigen